MRTHREHLHRARPAKFVHERDGAATGSPADGHQRVLRRTARWHAETLHGCRRQRGVTTVRRSSACVERVALKNTFMGVLVSGPAAFVTRAAVTRALPRFSDVSAKQSRRES